MLKNIGLLVLATYAFWALYVFTMGVYRAKMNGRLRGLNYVLGFPIVLLAVVVDFLFNVFVATFVFMELPRETLVTTRLQRYMATETGWRYRIAKAICDGVLDPFDPKENHC